LSLSVSLSLAHFIFSCLLPSLSFMDLHALAFSSLSLAFP
jgi:hypothetical protein